MRVLCVLCVCVCADAFACVCVCDTVGGWVVGWVGGWVVLCISVDVWVL